MTLPLVDRFANSGVGFGARATLASDPGASGVTLTLTIGHGARFPAVVAGERLMLNIDDELLTVTAHTANADTMTVTRGSEGTTGATHAAGSTVAVVVSATQMQAWQRNGVAYLPRYNNLIAAVGDPAFFAGQTDTANAGMHLSKIYLPEPVTLSNIVLRISVGGASLDVGKNYGVVYNSAGTLIGKTADQAASGFLSSGDKTLALTVEGGQSLTLGGPDVYVQAGLMTSGTTRPLYRVFSGEDAVNLNLTGLALRTATTAGGLSAPPATIVGGDLSANFRFLWVGLS